MAHRAEQSEHSAPIRPRNRRTYELGAGPAFDRVAYFSDAVFAIAMTLLIVSVEAPELRGAVDDPSSMLRPLGDLAPQLFSFFLAFLLLGRYWMAHHGFFGALRRVDGRLIALNLLYLSFVAFLPFPAELVGKYERNPISVVTFAIVLALLSGVESLLLRDAYRRAHFIRQLTQPGYRYALIQSLTPVTAFVLSVPVAFWNPTVAWLTWLLTIPIGSLVDRRWQDERRAFLDTMDATPGID